MTATPLQVRVNPALVRTREIHTLASDKGKLIDLIGAWDSLWLKETLVWMLAQSS